MSGMKNVADVLRGHAKTRGDKVALVYRGRETDFAALDRRASQVANGLIAAGVRPQQRVALLTKNCDQFMELYYGCAKANAVIVPVNFRLAGPEIAYIVNDAGAEVFFVGEGFADLAAENMAEMPKVRQVISLEGEGGYEDYATWRDRQSDADPMVDNDPDDIASQLYSSGTTGHPKGVQLSHQSGLNLWPLLADPNEPAYGRWSEKDVNLVCMPLYHVGGLNNALAGLYVGARTVIMAEALPAEILKLIPEQRVTKSFLVPALILFLLQTPGCRDTDFSSLDEIWYGAAPIPVELLKQALEVFGPVFGQAYGMTESNGGGVYMPKADHDLSKPERLKSCGKPAPGYEVKVVDEDGREVPVGEVGEIILKSNTLMAGYWNLPEATAKTLRDGWLWSGDAGYFDAEGFLYIYDRVKDMIISGGENIYPAEIESALFGHPAIADVAIIGVPDERWGEAVKAVVVKKPDAALSEAEVIDYARQRIAHYKCPKSVDFVDELPRNPTGKILKRELRKPYWEEIGRQVS
ncbi:MAG: acyl-CoA synthetase [Rhizobiales bacterium NRL2]|jgi:acyl-CoA synthetase (AMP-forming)/AMP-acid ligase II|nr:MAG: acyl-CoA synthetase [Rhizobiales bacterium NRL2]